jgi:guanine deaminase
MLRLKELQREYGLPVQSHLSENNDEIEWVRELCPEAASYGDAYDRFGLFGGKGTPTVMAHCVWSKGAEEELLRDNGVFVAHCPQSNTNLASGIAPIRRFMKKGIRVGLGSDVAGGCHISIFRAMSDALQVSKLYWKLVDQNDAPLSLPEAFYLGTAGGGGFFGKVGSFEEGYEFDAVVIDDSGITSSNPLTVQERLSRVIYFPDEISIVDKYVRGAKCRV